MGGAVARSMDMHMQMQEPTTTAHRADADELARAAAGDGAAFRRLYDAHHGRVVRLAYGVLQDREQARDVAHDVMIKLLEVAERWQAQALVSTWLRTVTLRQCFSWRRRLAVRRAHFDASSDEPREQSPTADASAALADDKRRLRAALRTLGARDRALIVLHVDEDLDPKDIAAALGITDNAARVRLHRALDRLRSAMGEHR